jgi:hypothetical protein
MKHTDKESENIMNIVEGQFWTKSGTDDDPIAREYVDELGILHYPDTVALPHKFICILL